MKSKQFQIDEDTLTELKKRSNGLTLVNTIRTLLGLPLLSRNWRKEKAPTVKE